jgi:phosphatidylglycerophosphatase A
MKLVWKIIATFLGVGFAFPLAPGTAASAIIVLLYKLVLFKMAWIPYAAVVIAVFLIGVVASGRLSAELKVEDPRCVVIDEACGQLTALFLCPASWGLLVAAFVLFRLFDIIKPYPIRKLENLPAGWGIMADDLAGGIFGGILIHAYLLLR